MTDGMAAPNPPPGPGMSECSTTSKHNVQVPSAPLHWVYTDSTDAPPHAQISKLSHQVCERQRYRNIIVCGACEQKTNSAVVHKAKEIQVAFDVFFCASTMALFALWAHLTIAALVSNRCQESCVASGLLLPNMSLNLQSSTRHNALWIVVILEIRSYSYVVVVYSKETDEIARYTRLFNVPKSLSH
eukprot:6157102-Amphidinium_carterae.1